MKSISVLLPTYNCDCVALVTELQRQCVAEGIDFEIIVADDASPIKAYIKQNECIERLEGVRYIRRTRNVGRSAIRNFLISQASKEWLLFIDGDLALDKRDFIKSYLEAEGEVIVGGITITDDDEEWGRNLRYRYEKRYEQSHNAALRQRKATQNFRTTNFMAHRDVMGKCPFDESFTEYGYEDVLLGKSFARQGVHLSHTDNPILLSCFEPNDEFLDKTEESLRTLSKFKRELEGYSNLLNVVQKIRRYHCIRLLNLFYSLFNKSIKQRLKSNKPSVFLFNTYKLMYFVHYDSLKL